MLRKVRIADPAAVMERYPHQLSGGMQQRVVIAMALAKDPTLLILDEPTTGLDATVEAEVLELVPSLRQEFGTSVLFISHNLAVIAKMCDRVGVLYAGKLVEEGPARALFDDPRHPYTVGLLRCIPRGGQRKDQRPARHHPRLPAVAGRRPAGLRLRRSLRARRRPLPQRGAAALRPRQRRSTRCHYHERAQSTAARDPGGARRAAVDSIARAVPIVDAKGVSQDVPAGGPRHPRAVRRLAGGLAGRDARPGRRVGQRQDDLRARRCSASSAPDDGSVARARRQAARRRPSRKRSSDEIRAMQIVFQNPDSALNRRHTVRRIVGRALTKLGGLRGRRATSGSSSSRARSASPTGYPTSRPPQLSGGLKQRVAIARAFAGDPQIVVCDEPTSALDVSVQAAILNLLAELQRDDGASRTCSSRTISASSATSRTGSRCSISAGSWSSARPSGCSPGRTIRTRKRCCRPCRRSTATERERIRLEGEIPSAADPPSGCVFHTRCPRKIGEICEQEEPPLAEVEPGHMMRCHIPIDELRRAPGAADGRRSARGARGGRPVRIRGAVLPRTGAPLEVEELDLAPPGPGEVLVRLHASGVCHSDLNAIDGTAETRCPAVLGHEGAGVVSRARPGVVASARHACGSVVASLVRALRGVSARSAAPLPHRLVGDGPRRPLRRDAPPFPGR